MSQITRTTPRRDELVEIADQLFYRQGFGATGVKQIIDEAGMAKGTFYSHFDSKEEIGIAWLRKRNAEWNQGLEQASGKAKSPRAKILVLFDVLKKWMDTNDFRGCAFLNSLAELPQSNGEMRELIRQHKEGIRDYITELSRAHFPDRPKSYSDHKGTVIYLLFEGALVSGQNFRDQWPIEAARKEAKAILQEQKPPAE